MTLDQPLMESTIQRLYQLVGDLAPEPVPPPRPSARLVEDLGYHSLALAELAIAVGDLLGIDSVTDQTLSEYLEAGTVLDIECLVRDILAGGGI